MEERVAAIEKRQKEDSAVLKEIRDRLIGNAMTNNKGLVDDVHQNTIHRRRSAWYAAFFVAIGTFFGGVFQVIKLKLGL